MSSNTNGISKRSQVTLGEAVDPSDYNNFSAWERANINDLVLSAAMRMGAGDTFPGGGLGSSQCPPIFAIGHSGAPRNGRTTARTYGCNPGPIFQAPNSTAGIPDGNGAKVLSYYLQGGEINGQLAAGDATHPRWDCVYVRLSEVDGPLVTRNFEDATGVKSGQALPVDKRTKLDWTVVQGTPAAIPGIPGGPDASYSLWGAWFVPATFGASLFGLNNIYDFRVPIGFRRLQVDPGVMGFDVAHWSYQYDKREVTSSSTTGLWAPCPVRSGRIMGYKINYRDFAASPGLQALVINGRGLGGSPTGNKQPAGGPNEPNNGQNFGDYEGWQMWGGVWIDPTDGHSYAPQSAVTSDGYTLLPLWANGYGSEAEEWFTLTNTTTEQRTVQVQYFPTASGDTICNVIFEVAGGF